MRLPGFNAELSLLKPATSYQALTHRELQAGTQSFVIPQRTRCWCWRDPDLMTVTCVCGDHLVE
jgi:hypothetical protein